MKCGESDERNEEYNKNFDEQTYFKYLITEDAPIVFDIGAHKGESILFFKEIWPNSKIHSFEPDPESFAILEQYKNDAVINNVAVSNVIGSQEFYRQSISSLNGLSKINNSSNDSLGYAINAVNEKIDVNVQSGDNYSKNAGIKKINLLKIDTQGNEVNVLKGFQEMLPFIDIVVVEILLFDFYESNSSFYEIESELRHAFELYDILKVSKNPQNYRTDWVEVVYMNKKYNNKQ